MSYTIEYKQANKRERYQAAIEDVKSYLTESKYNRLMVDLFPEIKEVRKSVDSLESLRKSRTAVMFWLSFAGIQGLAAAAVFAKLWRESGKD